MESMETGNNLADESSGLAHRLDPNRTRTDAEVATFAEVFRISVNEARRILKRSGKKKKITESTTDEGGALS